MGPWAAEGKTAEEVADADIVLWDGYCQVHERFTPEHVAEVRADHEDANVVVHPECRREVVEAADVVGSTATITETVADADPGRRGPSAPRSTWPTTSSAGTPR